MIKTRTKIKTEMEEVATKATGLNPHTNVRVEGTTDGSLTELLDEQGLRQAATPSNVNCQYYAIAEVVLQKEMTADSEQLVGMTATITTTIAAAALVHLEAEFPANVRK